MVRWILNKTPRAEKVTPSFSFIKNSRSLLLFVKVLIIPTSGSIFKSKFKTAYEDPVKSFKEFSFCIDSKL